MGYKLIKNLELLAKQLKRNGDKDSSDAVLKIIANNIINLNDYSQHRIFIENLDKLEWKGKGIEHLLAKYSIIDKIHEIRDEYRESGAVIPKEFLVNIEGGKYRKLFSLHNEAKKVTNHILHAIDKYESTQTDVTALSRDIKDEIHKYNTIIEEISKLK